MRTTHRDIEILRLNTILRHMHGWSLILFIVIVKYKFHTLLIKL